MFFQLILTVDFGIRDMDIVIASLKMFYMAWLVGFTNTKNLPFLF